MNNQTHKLQTFWKYTIMLFIVIPSIPTLLDFLHSNSSAIISVTPGGGKIKAGKLTQYQFISFSTKMLIINVMLVVLHIIYALRFDVYSKRHLTENSWYFLKSPDVSFTYYAVQMRIRGAVFTATPAPAIVEVGPAVTPLCHQCHAGTESTEWLII